MTKKKITRMERFKDEIKDSKLYRSIEKETLQNSKSIQDKKTSLKNLDKNFFAQNIEHNIAAFKPLEKAKFFDYSTKSKLKDIEDELTKSKFNMLSYQKINDKVIFSKDLLKQYQELDRKQKLYQNRVDHVSIELNKLISELKTKEKEIEANKDINQEIDLEELANVEKDLFEKTQQGKLRLTDTTSMYVKNQKFIKNKKNILPILIGLTTILILLLTRG